MARGIEGFSHEKVSACIFSMAHGAHNSFQLIFTNQIKHLLLLLVGMLTNTKGNYLLVSLILSL
jgi:hypothetical protein